MPDTCPQTEFAPLGRLADIRVSNVDKKTVAGELPVRLCNYTDVYNAEYLTATHPYMHASATYSEIQRFAVQVNDVIITKDSETPDDIGVAAVIDEAAPDLVCGYHLAMIRPSAALNPVWLSKQFGHARLQRHLSRVAAGTTRYGLSNGAIASLPIFVPPRAQQDFAAAVLRTLDETIRKTEQLIAKLQQAKQGLLHDLLTRGIDDNGELRDPERGPGQFKDSVLGRIPEDWDVSAIGDLLEHLIDFRGRTPKKLGKDWGDGEIPALSAKNVRMGSIDLSLETYYGSDSLYEKWMTHGDCQKGDVLVTMEAPLGNIAQIPDDRRYILSQRVVLYRFDSLRINNDFMAVYMRSNPFQRALIDNSTGTTATGIQRARFVKINAPVPTVDEQGHICETVRASDQQIKMEEATLEKYRSLKQGLMDDLLTGRVRVPTEA